ncbi:hypothetical protein PHYSODRAFT_340882 [Phytophthora sojae]|uniref:Uncharacterized protein n=1 Tax=Phytophthora sojae (strain P6497) TaxID=1094619 RepID=G5ABD7_PHYSP|nr:hypothetical protein PHYSODRAFT_340882 [Phytophthora sojae]EGZ06662.1 hypothetical protein PHYSODRAFT_340882 [Phytophthora sojae]|eukprot:XP_009537426.1 hypothetical protein PHYSODRAFT_340882 [Phytophthora sojae]
MALSSGVHAEKEVGVPGVASVGVGPGVYGPGVVGPAVGVGVPGVVGVGVNPAVGYNGGTVVNGGYPAANGGATATATANARRTLRSVQ